MESMILGAKKEFQKILDYILNDAQNQQIHEVERGIFVSLVQLGLILIKLFLEAKGDGNMGETHTNAEGVTRPLHTTKKEKIYFSIFGKIVIERAYYWLKGKGGLCPLDEELNLPEDSYSYLLLDLQVFSFGCLEYILLVLLNRLVFIEIINMVVTCDFLFYRCYLLIEYYSGKFCAGLTVSNLGHFRFSENSVPI
jgi:hypothetical protein